MAADPVVVEHPTGAEDPLEPLKPEDPYGLTLEHDPLEPDEADPAPTPAAVGIRLPPAPAATAPQLPPGHVELASAIKRLGPLPQTEERNRVKTWKVVQEGRYSLAEHWSMLQTLQLATADVAAELDATPAEEHAKIDALRQDLAGDGPLRTALDDFCAARDGTPVDLEAVADAAVAVRDAVDALARRLGETSIHTGSGAAGQRWLLAEVLDGFVSEVNGEARQVLAGERVSRGTSSDVMTFHLTKMTRDRAWTSRLMTAGTWAKRGDMMAGAVRAQTLDLPVSKGSGRLRLNALVTFLTAVDAALQARDDAGDQPDYATRAEVLRQYSASADALGSMLATVRARGEELSKSKSRTAGWNAEQAHAAGDLLAGTARALQTALAADPLVQDPDLARTTRSLLERIDGLALQTSLEALVDKAPINLRKAWENAQKSELKALKAAKVDLGDLPDRFDRSLGRLLDEWAAETKKFPKHRADKVRQLTAEIAEQLQRYRTAIKITLGNGRSPGLVEGLDVVTVAMARRIQSYDSRGGLF